MLGCWGGGQGEAFLTPSARTLQYRVSSHLLPGLYSDRVSLSGPFSCQPRGPGPLPPGDVSGLLLVPMALESLCLSLSRPLGQGLLTLL